VTRHYLSSARVHRCWDNSLPPLVEADPGDTLELQTLDAMGRYFSATSTAEDVTRMPPFPGHPLTGPVFIKGAMPGDVLEIHIERVQPDSWGWTMIMPGRGLLPEVFSEPHLRIWDLSDGCSGRWNDAFSVPLDPFCGIAGVAPRQAGQHSTRPPGSHGGNMDLKHVTAGSCLLLPVQVPGALLSLGDAHAAQGDGEVCVTAIEMCSEVTIRLGLRKDLSIAEPQLLVGHPLNERSNSGQ
jgi:acetamidase/formamidase